MRLFSLLILASALAISLTSCTKRDPDEKLTVFRRSLKDDVKTLDPANAFDSISLEVVPSIYETLYQYSYLDKTYRIVPLLAADMPSYSRDRLTVTIPIKRGVKFQDDPAFKDGKGRGLRASDFVRGMKRLALPGLQSTGWWVVDGKIAGINAFREHLSPLRGPDLWKALEEPVEGLKALDEHTLQIKLTKPYPQLLYVLAMTFTAPIAEEADAAYRDQHGHLTDHPVGTGPFMLKKWDRGHGIEFVANPGHHPEFYPTDASPEYVRQGLLESAGKSLPFLDKIYFEVLKEQQPSWLRFMKGEFDVLTLPKDNFDEAITSQVNLSPALKEKGIQLSIEAGTSFYFIGFNMRDRLVGKNKYLRQAISAAIDRDRWIELFTNGHGKKMVNALPPGIADRPNATRIKYDFNQPLARELLRKAGFPDGKGLPPLTLDMRGADTVSRQLGEFLSNQLAALGIKVNVIHNTFPAFLEKAKQGHVQIFQGGWSMDYPDAENAYQLLYGPNQAPGPNSSNFDHPRMNELYAKMSVIESGSIRAAIVNEMDEILQEEVPWALGYYSTEYRLIQGWVRNYRGSELILNAYKYYRVDKELKKTLLAAASEKPKAHAEPEHGKEAHEPEHAHSPEAPAASPSAPAEAADHGEPSQAEPAHVEPAHH